MSNKSKKKKKKGDKMRIKNVFVIGAGFMGSGIVENVATKGLPVAVYDVNVLSLMKSEANIKKRLDNQVFREKISEEERDEIRRIHDYDLCEIASYDIDDGSEEFINWLKYETK